MSQDEQFGCCCCFYNRLVQQSPEFQVPDSAGDVASITSEVELEAVEAEAEEDEEEEADAEVDDEEVEVDAVLEVEVEVATPLQGLRGFGIARGNSNSGYDGLVTHDLGVVWSGRLVLLGATLGHLTTEA